MLFTVDEARALKPTLAQIKELKKEFGTYKSVVNAFSVWFFILTTVRALVVSTVIVSMFNQEPDLMIAWNKGEGVGFFLLYLVVSCLPIIGNLVNLVAPIAVVVAAFATGGGIASNFAPFVLPIAIAYAVTFGLIFFSNSLINSIIKSSCPKIYEEIKYLSGANEFSRMFYASSIQARNAAYDAEEEQKTEDAEEAEIVNDTKNDDENSQDDDGYYDDML